MRFLIHMGNYKTGSTALQNYLYQNSGLLAQNHIYYGQTDPEPLCSHASFTYSLLRMTLQKMGLFDACQSHPMYQYIQQSPKHLLEQMQNEAAARHCDTILLSHEAMFCEAWRTLNGLRHVPASSPFSEQEIWEYFHQNLFDLLQPISQEIRVIVYLRRQDDYLESQYNQYVKAPWWEETIQLPDFTEFMSLHPVTLDYTKPLEILKKVYGIQNMTVLSYRRHSHFYHDFAAQILKLPPDSVRKFKQPETAMENRSISHDSVDFKCKFLSPDAAFHSNIQTLLAEYSALYPDQQNYTYFTPELHERFIQLYEAGNHYINQVYLEEKDALPAFDSLDGKTFYTGITPDHLQNLVNYLTETAAQSSPVRN
ncbi:MAG: hypothetical protein LUH14_04450 [Clostridiaceae bacterium]|nr:hypothetical protein [Clostridiaceae bacterium]